MFFASIIFSTFSAVIKAPQMEPLKIPLNREHAAIDDISVWEWSGSALDEGNEAFEWFTKYLGKPSRLVRFNTGIYFLMLFYFFQCYKFFSPIIFDARKGF